MNPNINNTPPPLSPRKKKSNKEAWLWALAIVALAAIAGGLLYANVYHAGSTTAKAEQQVEESQPQDFETREVNIPEAAPQQPVDNNTVEPADDNALDLDDDIDVENDDNAPSGVPRHDRHRHPGDPGVDPAARGPRPSVERDPRDPRQRGDNIAQQRPQQPPFDNDNDWLEEGVDENNGGTRYYNVPSRVRNGRPVQPQGQYRQGYRPDDPYGEDPDPSFNKYSRRFGR